MEKKEKSNPSNQKEFEDLMKIFSYNKNLPLGFEEKSNLEKNELEHKDHIDNIPVFDVSYNGAKKRVNAYLVKSSKEKISPGVVFVHPSPGTGQLF